MTHACLKSHFLPLPEYTTGGGGVKRQPAKVISEKTKLAKKSGWHILIRTEGYYIDPLLLSCSDVNSVVQVWAFIGGGDVQCGMEVFYSSFRKV